MSVQEKIKIAHLVLVQNRLQREVAADHGVTQAHVSTICKKAKENGNYLRELVRKRDEKAARQVVVAETVQEMNQLNVFVDSAGSVRKVLADAMDVKVSEQEIREIMKRDLGMRYRKVLPVSIHGNNERNLVLRQQYAIRLIHLLKEGKTILNVDETWLGMSDFRRRKWKSPNTTNSVAKLSLVPRVSMIAGLDSRGKVYLSLLQANSNGQVMEIFFRQLVVQLDRER